MSSPPSALGCNRQHFPEFIRRDHGGVSVKQEDRRGRRPLSLCAGAAAHPVVLAPAPDRSSRRAASTTKLRPKFDASLTTSCKRLATLPCIEIHSTRRGGRGMKTSVLLALVALLSSGAVDCAAQSTTPYRGALTVTVENDVGSSDNNYTNGVGLTWVSYDSILRAGGASSAGGVSSGRSCCSLGMKVSARMCPFPLLRRCIRRTTSQTRTRHWTTSPMPVCCTSTVSSIRERNGGLTRGSSESALWAPHRRLTTYRSGSTE